jgi:alpha-mannosidase
MTIRRGYEFNYALQALQVPTHIGSLPPAHSFLGINNSNVILTAVKRSEDDRSLILRCYEWAGLDSTVTLAIPAGAEAATRANLMEQADPTPISLSNNEVRFEIRPFEIATVRVEYPASPRNSD